MLTVRIDAGGGYEVLIGHGLLRDCGRLIGRHIERCRIAVITDTVVRELYLESVTASLTAAGFAVTAFSFPAGEQSKNMGTLQEILDFLAGERLTRSDCLAALGGGVVGDLGGFAAGCYLRGLRYLQLPTTLLAAVDSSVGGKTAVNLKAGKNLAGLFLQPSAVLSDTAALETLPPALLADGCAEAIKTAVLSGEPLFKLLESGLHRSSLPEVIAGCVDFKGRVVEADEFEAGPRRILNLGHTVGHALEKCSDYRISHGHAVAAGTAVIARAAVKLGWGSPGAAARIEGALLRNSLPVTAPFSAAALTAAALSDKKRAGSEITLVIPREIGNCTLRKVAVTELHDIIAAGLEARR